MHAAPATVDHEVTGSYPGLNNVKGLEAYSARALAMCLGRTDDVVRLPGKEERSFRVLEHYFTKELELELPEVRYSDESGAFLNGPHTATHNPFVFRITPEVLKQRPELRPMKKIQDFFEHKNNWIEDCTGRGCATPTTYYCDAKRRNTIPTRLTGRWWVKLAISATGDGSWLLSGPELWQKIESLRRSRIDFQVQEHITGVVCSAQCWSGEFAGVVLSTSEQIMANGKTHTGNIFPSTFDHQLRKRAWDHADHLWRAGYRGYFGVDFIKADGVYDLEANMRPGGGHYAAAVAGALNIEECMSVIVTDVRNSRLWDPATFMGHLRVNELLWTQKDPYGVIPWCISTLPAGKVMLLIPGKRKEQEAILRAFRLECC